MTKTVKCMLAAVLALAFAAGVSGAADDDLFKRAPLFGSVGLNWLQLEGDVEAESGLGIHGKLGYSLNSWWDVEGGLYFMPALGAAEMENPSDELDGDTTAVRLSLDVLLHLRNQANRRIDPFLKDGALSGVAKPSSASRRAAACFTISTTPGRCAPMRPSGYRERIPKWSACSRWA